MKCCLMILIATNYVYHTSEVNYSSLSISMSTHVKIAIELNFLAGFNALNVFLFNSKSVFLIFSRKLFKLFILEKL